jgi:tetratricopeptide (TPR) repeat protein
MAVNKNKVMEIAQKFAEKGQTDKAIKEYLKIVQDDPKDVRVWLKVGDLYSKKGSKQEATDTYLKVAQFYSDQGFYLKAVAVYKQILKLDPRLVDVNVRLADVYRQLGLLSDAMQQYELVAAFYHREGRNREALATIKLLVEMDPDNVATRIKLAELYSKEQMVAEAVAEFAQAADYLRAQSREDDFVKVAERLVWHQPDNHAMNRELAGLYLKRNDPRHALQKLQVCFKANPRDGETLALLASAFVALDQKPKAVSVWKELARILTEDGKAGEALDVYRRILNLEPMDNEAQTALAAGGRRVGGATVQTPAAPRAPLGVPSQPPPSAHAAAMGGAPPTRLSAPMASVRTPTALGDLPPPSRRTGAMPLVNVKEALGLDDDDAGAELAASSVSTSGARALEVELEIDDQVPSEDALLASAGDAEAHAEEIAKILTETEVYIKYSLHQKAIEHLRRVFELDARNVEAREKLKDIYVALGRQGEAAEELARLVELLAPSSRERAAGVLRELETLAPGDERVGALAARFNLHGAAVAGAAEAELPEFEVEDVSLVATAGAVPVAVEADAVDSDGMELDFDDVVDIDGPGRHEDVDEFSLDAPEAAPPIVVAQGTGVPRPAQSQAQGHGHGNLEDDLDEADFFVSQNLFAEARNILVDLLGRYPSNPLVVGKVQELDVLERDSTGGRADDRLANAPHGSPMPSPLPEKKRPAVIARGLTPGDAETHFDLGLAYKEMGLYDEAIKEFNMVLGTPGKTVVSHKMIGLCHAGRGKYAEAVAEFKNGLYIEGLTEDESLDLYFEIGVAHETLGDLREAMFYFEKVAKRDPRFRDVQRRLEAASAAAGPAPRRRESEVTS